MDILIVEAGRRSAGYARFERKGGGLFFLGAVRQPQEGPDDFPRFLAEVSSSGIRAERALLSLDPESLFTRELELPITDRRKQREILPLEMKGETALSMEELMFDAIPLQGGRIMAVWGVCADLESRIAALTGAGLEPQIVGSSLYHWNLLIPENIGAGSVAISDGRALAVYAGGEPLLFRALGEGDIHRQIDSTLALLEAGRDVRVEQVFLHGRVAACSEQLEASPVTFAPLPVHAGLAAAFPDEGSALEYAGAWALATASLRGEPVNFRHGRLAYTAGNARLKRKLRLTAFLAALFLLLLLGETGLRYYFVKSDLDSLDKSILQIYREVFPNRTKPVDEVSELKSEIRRLGGGATGPGVLQSLNLIAGAKSDGIIGMYEAEIDGLQVLLKGDASSFQAVNDFKSGLSPLFDSMAMDEVKSKPDGSVSFVFRGTLKEGGK
jgi:general secretion pathway protein L